MDKQQRLYAEETECFLAGLALHESGLTNEINLLEGEAGLIRNQREITRRRRRLCLESYNKWRADHGLEPYREE